MDLVNNHEIVGVGTLVHPEGDYADLTFHTGSGATHLTMPFAQIASAASQIHRAALLMVYRQAMTRDGGQAAIKAMASTALRPKEIGVTIDPATGDRLFLLQFSDQPPMIIRMSPDAVNETLVDIETVSKRAAN